MSRSNVDRRARGGKEGDDKMKLNEVEENEVEMSHHKRGKSDRTGDNKKSFRGTKYIQISQDGIRKQQEKGEG